MRPIFIGGCGRSGTTLLGAMLGAHPDAVATPESPFKTEVLAGLPAALGPADIERAARRIGNHFRYRLWQAAPEGTSMDAPSADAAPSAPYPALLLDLVRRYAAGRDKPAARFWIDHTPDNTAHAATLLALFPEARLIHLVRDGRAVAASVLPLDWGPNTITQAGRWWGQKLAYGLGAESSPLAARVLRVRLEDVVREPAAALERISAFAGLAVHPAMLAGGGFQVPEYSSAQHARVGQAPDPAVLTRWERTLSPRDIELFEWLTGDLLECLGYVPRFGARARGPSRREHAALLARETLRRVQNPYRQRRRRRDATP
ncbi:MAG: sulfotransferase [Gemmatimonadota bacterium]